MISYTPTFVKSFKGFLSKIRNPFLKSLFLVGLVLLVGFLLSYLVPVTEAGTGDRISGWAWSETIGWVSFNCTNQGVCGQSNYGVNIDIGTGDFSGYAWSENIGWINFDPAGPYPTVPNYPVKVKPLDLSKLGQGNVSVTGWAKALANGGGWDGWILLGKESGGWTNQVIIDKDGYFHGFAWGGRDTDGGAGVVGWIKFNCADSTPEYPTGVCKTSNYKVFANLNDPPTVTTADETWDYCLDSRNPTLNWVFSDPNPGDSQSAYQIQIDNNSNFSSPEIDTGKVFSSSNSYHPTGTTLNWNTKYYWRVMVWDSHDAPSVWSNTNNFTTPLHSYPRPDFSWSPDSPSAMEPVQFTDKSTCYDDVITGSDCSSDTGFIDSFKWTIPKTQYADPLISFEENPVATFSEEGNWNVTLEVTDSDGFMCPKTQTVNVSEPLPWWKEIIPR